MGLQSDYRRLRSRLRKQMDFAARRELDPMDPPLGQLEARLDRGVENPPRTPRSGKPGGFLCKDRAPLSTKMIRNGDGSKLSLLCLGE